MARKILLVFDDYSEMIRTQGDLMKVGFDLGGVVNEALLSDQIWNLNPELVITAGKGGKVSAIRVAQKLKEMGRYHGKVIVLLPQEQRPSADELLRMRMDALGEFPISLPRLFSLIGKILGLDGAALTEKYLKSRLAEGAKPEELLFLRETPPLDRAAREARALEGISIDSKSTSFERAAVKARLDELKKDWDFRLLDEIDELKRKFVEALFKK